MKRLLSLIFFIVCVLPVFGVNDSIIRIDNPQKKMIKNHLFSYEDPTAFATYEEIKQGKKLIKMDRGTPNFGIKKSAFWFRFTIQNNSQQNLFLEIANPVLSDVHFYDPLLSGQNPIREGQNIPYSQKEQLCTNIVFDLNLKPGTTKTYFLRVKSQTQIQLPLYIGARQELLKGNFYSNLAAALFLGLMTAMILYNLAIYFIVKDVSYLYYVLFVLVILVVQLVPKGFAFQYFWPESPRVANAAMFFAPAISGTASIFFFNSFLKVKHYALRLRQILLSLLVIYAIALVLYGFDFYYISYSILDLNSLLISILMLGGAFYIYKKGNNSALFFLIAWSVFLIGVVVFVLKDLAVLPHNFFTNYTMMIGASLETILLSIGLANRINLLKKEKEVAQRKELDALLENEKLINEQKELLEKKVNERTKKLNEALDSIKKAQNKLIESEKMASIGQLTAGIAHEINNPINYVTSNISSLERDIREVEVLLEAYSFLNQDNFADKIIEIETMKSDIDYQYLREEIPTLLEGIKEGANRTAKIVASLRSFSNKDKPNKTKTDILLGINSTLILLNKKLDGIEVVTNHQLKKEVYCFPGKINQVIMNIITNAIDAIHEKKKGQECSGKIEISTFEGEGDMITIKIKDNGIGMNEETQKKIFDPFFTLKDVGSGTGLGMALTYQYIKLHDGEITIESMPNMGSTITVSFKNAVENA